MARVTLKFDGWPKKTIGHLFYNTTRFVHHFKAIGHFKLKLQSRNDQFGSKLLIFFVLCDLEIWWMSLKHLFYTVSSFVHHFKAIGEFKLELQSGNAQFGSKSVIFFPAWPRIWQMTLENNRAHLLYYIKLCASFQNHQWIQTVTARKRSIRVKISDFLSRVTLKFDR